MIFNQLFTIPMKINKQFIQRVSRYRKFISDFPWKMKQLQDLEYYCFIRQPDSYFELLKFLGIASYYADYMSDYVEHSGPLYNLIIDNCPDVEFQLDEINITHFIYLQRNLCEVYQNFIN